MYATSLGNTTPWHYEKDRRGIATVYIYGSMHNAVLWKFA